MRFLHLLILATSLSERVAYAVAIPSTENDINNPTQLGEQSEEEKWAALRKYEDSMKYFHEPGQTDLLGHYDTRYYKGLLTYEEKRDTQVHMVRAYLDTFREKGIETWIAHGTLLGWWWNGKMLPWDWDIDTQVSGSTLEYLGTHLNNTMHTYTSASASSHNDPVTRTYLLDVNPYAAERDRGDGFNIIDARWIDVHNGLYIDITGLSETHPDVQPGVWSCKNYHRYKVTDLYPMRETTYEGAIAKVPYAYDRILLEEYEEKALVVTEFEGHRWDPTSKEWIKNQNPVHKR